MKSYLNGYTLGNQILMMKGKKKGMSFLVVEGRTDSFGYYWLINREKCFPIAAHSKINVIDTIRFLEVKNADGVLGIIDSDFWNLENVALNSNNLAKTDTHDIETIVLSTPALEKLLLFYGDIDKIPSIENVTNKLLEAGKPLGYLRWVSSKRNMNLNFKGLDFNCFVDDETLNVNLENMISAVINNTQKCKLKLDDLKKIVEFGLKNSTHSPWQVCCGHDLVEVLCISLSKLFGSFGTPAKNNTVSKWLLLAYESAYFEKTGLYSSILDWEARNTPYIILSDQYKNQLSKKLVSQIS
ncbi:DUF4435 domain-containing protein [Paenibacillus sp. LMG 31458]|uniref:DUF4435 domain-containing protein n=1 Tax=Paenibacillus phytorum TaxID=2654977 RepID=A0ABX1Y689_9BACL|nr:DUF4435 domain-containing protein [Paenibacillus phytorum]NOU75500.1 DUF4435 domain-containing protein [Paenibacillus phytorum]